MVKEPAECIIKLGEGERIKLAFNCIKDTDFIIVGMAFPEEIEENAELVRKLTT